MKPNLHVELDDREDKVAEGLSGTHRVVEHVALDRKLEKHDKDTQAWLAIDSRIVPNSSG